MKLITADQGAPSRWGPQFTPKPSKHIRLNGVDRHEDLFDMSALDALERAFVELQPSGLDARKGHRAVALRTLFSTGISGRFECGDSVFNMTIPSKRAQSSLSPTASHGTDNALLACEVVVNIAHFSNY